MNEEPNNPRIHDPKMVPSNRAPMTLDLSEAHYRQLEQDAHEAGCWSIEEYIRSRTAQAAEEYERGEIAATRQRIIPFPSGEPS
jgi:hypothetical protein